MLIPENENSPKPQQNEKLSWTKYRYCAKSCDFMLYGTVTVEKPGTREELTARMIELVAYQAHSRHRKWNCFNMDIVLKGV